jgi:hypothetical protein
VKEGGNLIETLGELDFLRLDNKSGPRFQQIERKLRYAPNWKQLKEARSAAAKAR